MNIHGNMRGMKTTATPDSSRSPWRKQKGFAKARPKTKGELYQLSLARAARPAYLGMDDLNEAGPSADLAAAFGPSQDRATEAVDWSGYHED